MSKIKVLLLGSLAALGILGATAGAASAAQTLACPEFTGHTDGLTPVQFVGGTGTYHFSGAATCSLNGGAPTTSATIVSSGSYNNTACGTGTADGSAVITVNGTPVNLTYHIQFVGGLGTITGTGGSTGGGPVSIRPALDNQASPPGNCVTDFDVVGGFAGTA